MRKTVSETEFGRGAAISRMEPCNIAVARAVLVEGRRQADIAREHGLTRQSVSATVAKMRKYIQAANPVPPGWLADTVVLPKSDWPQVRAIEKAARGALKRRR